MGHLEDTGTDRRLILRWIFKKRESRRRYWIDLTQDRSKWRALVNVAMNLQVP